MTFYYFLLLLKHQWVFFHLCLFLSCQDVSHFLLYWSYPGKFLFLCLSSMICLRSFFEPLLFSPVIYLIKFLTYLSQTVHKNDFLKYKPDSLPSTNLHDPSFTKPILYLSKGKKYIKITDYTIIRGT